jgi:hypothetical protein
MASLPDVSPRPFSVAEYHRMIDAGILTEDDRVELIEGVIVLVSPPCPAWRSWCRSSSASVAEATG